MDNNYYTGNILVVDDQPVNLSLVEKILQDLPAKIHKALSGKEALELAEKHQFALILLDVQMPEMDGFETAEKLRKIKHTENTPIIFVTAVGTDNEHMTKGYESGAVDYIIKPVTPFVLRSKVKIFLDLDRKFSDTDDKATHLEQKNREFIDTLNEIRIHHGLIPICSWCRKIKNDDGEWEKVEDYLNKISAAEFTKGVCPICAEKLRKNRK